MALPEQTTGYTVADYMQWPAELRCELIDGVIYDMAPAPTLAHQSAVGELYVCLHAALQSSTSTKDQGGGGGQPNIRPGIPNKSLPESQNQMKFQSTRLLYLLSGILALLLNGCATVDKQSPEKDTVQLTAGQNQAVAEQAYQQGRASYKKGDYPAAVQGFRQAADLGHAKAQYNLGMAYVQGQGVAKDYRQGINWFRKAADQNFALAQLNLGIAYAQGQGVEKDPRQAVEWFQKAAMQGFAPAQYNLGTMLYQGQGVAKDPVMAYVWLSLAAAQGKQEAQTAQDAQIVLRKVAKSLNPEQKARAHQLLPDYSRQYGKPAQA